MGLSDYLYCVDVDNFEAMPSRGLAFPCNACIHSVKGDGEAPCKTCNHNLNCVDDSKPKSCGCGEPVYANGVCKDCIPY